MVNILSFCVVFLSGLLGKFDNHSIKFTNDTGHDEHIKKLQLLNFSMHDNIYCRKTSTWSDLPTSNIYCFVLKQGRQLLRAS